MKKKIEARLRLHFLKTMNAHQYAETENLNENAMLGHGHPIRDPIREKSVYEYVWIDGDGHIRSKIRSIAKQFVMCRPPPDWNFDGSSTGQASGEDSEVILKPRAVYKFPNSIKTFSPYGHYLVLCDTWHRVKTVGDDGMIRYSELTPALNNHRYSAAEIFNIPEVSKEKFWFGLEQEYFLKPADKSYPGFCYSVREDFERNDGKFYCGVGASNVYKEECELVEQHMAMCMQMGINISGLNAEVAPGQWEFQIGPCEGIDAGDQLWAARYVLIKLAGVFNYDVIFDPKLIMTTQPGGWDCESESNSSESDEDQYDDNHRPGVLINLGSRNSTRRESGWGNDSPSSKKRDRQAESINGSGCHTNFSTKTMRSCPTKVVGSVDVGEGVYRQTTELIEKDPEAIPRRSNGVSSYIMNVIERLQRVHAEHMMVYGKGNESRMTGSCETASYDKFSFGVGDRGVSVRIPVDVFKKGYGYIEDRRPAANADPYLVTSFIARTTAPATTDSTVGYRETKVGIAPDIVAQQERKTCDGEEKVAQPKREYSEMDLRFARAHRECDEDYRIFQLNKRDEERRAAEADARPTEKVETNESETGSFSESSGELPDADVNAAHSINGIPPPGSFVETRDYGTVQLEDISDDGIIVLRLPRQFSERPNESGNLTVLPPQHIHVFREDLALAPGFFTDPEIDEALRNWRSCDRKSSPQTVEGGGNGSTSVTDSAQQSSAASSGMDSGDFARGVNDDGGVW